jgi:hypothetical protein
MFCYPAKLIEPPAYAPGGTRCWRGGNIIICQGQQGEITVHHPKK